MENETITVTGKGSVHIVPDVTRLELTLCSLHDSYEEAYAQAKSNTDKLGKIMKELKLPVSLPKTIRFDIDKRSKNEYDKYGHFTSEKFIGFQLNHIVKIDLGMDTVLLNKVIKTIGQELRQAEIKIAHTVKDARPAQLLMLERAVKDAKAKAEVMATAGDCQLGAVKVIDYSVHELKIYSEVRQIHDAVEACSCREESLDITPDDLDVSDQVSVTWYLQPVKP